jgi:hypothetical protein
MSRQEKPKRKKLSVALKSVRQLDDRALDRVQGAGKDGTGVSCHVITQNHNQRLRVR